MPVLLENTKHLDLSVLLNVILLNSNKTKLIRCVIVPLLNQCGALLILCVKYLKHVHPYNSSICSLNCARTNQFVLLENTMMVNSTDA